MKVKLLLAALLITGMSVQCTDKRDIIEENIEKAKAQLDFR